MKPKIVILKKCNGCGKCAKICPVECLKVIENSIKVLDEDECFGCKMCMEKCPKDAIKIKGVVP